MVVISVTLSHKDLRGLHTFQSRGVVPVQHFGPGSDLARPTSYISLFNQSW